MILDSKLLSKSSIAHKAVLSLELLGGRHLRTIDPVNHLPSFFVLGAHFKVEGSAGLTKFEYGKFEYVKFEYNN